MGAESPFWQQKLADGNSKIIPRVISVYFQHHGIFYSEILRQDNMRVFQHWWMDGWMDNTKYLVCRSGYKISLLKCLPNKTTLILNCTFVMSTLPVHEDFYKVVKRSKSLSACSLQSVFVCLSVWYPSVNAHAITGHSKQNTQIRTQYRAMWCS